MVGRFLNRVRAHCCWNSFLGSLVFTLKSLLPHLCKTTIFLYFWQRPTAWNYDRLIQIWLLRYFSAENILRNITLFMFVHSFLLFLSFWQWRIPRDGLGPCSRLDLWYLFVTIFSICTILGFGIFQMLVKSKEPETTAVFAAIYALCGIMILLRIHYFYVWFTRRSKFWRKWKTENRVWTVASPGTVLKYNEEGTIVWEF